jgi:hypothetical protein
MIPAAMEAEAGSFLNCGLGIQHGKQQDSISLKRRVIYKSYNLQN